MPGYSLKSLSSEIDFDVEDFIPLLELFIDSTELNLIEISDGVKKSDKGILSFNIHNIKGAAMNLGLEYISGIMEHMSMLNKNGSFADIKDSMDDCKAEIIELRQVLEKK
ncbi:MAG: Hpt domain-containing protein [Methylococcales bacterium]